MQANSSNSSQLKPLLYVCVMSGYNLAELESCIYRRPQEVVLLVSNHLPTQEGAERFTKVLKEALPNVKIRRPDLEHQETFDGENLQQTQNWIQKYLQPLLESTPLKKGCNITGGTKIFTLALNNSELGWDFIDYKGQGNNLLQVFEYTKNQQLALKEEKLELPNPSALAVAHLNSNNVKPTPESELFKHPKSLKLAQKTWEALSQLSISDKPSAESKSLQKLFGCSGSGLANIWVHNRNDKKFKKAALELSAKDFIQQQTFTTEDANWLESWHQLAPEQLKATPTSVYLPGSAGSSSLRRWISGDWLEQLVSSWLEEKLPAHHFATNLRLSPINEKSSLGERETDIVVHHNQKTYVIEIKANLPPTGGIREPLDQISSLGDRLGRINKIVFIGPQLLANLTKNNNLDNVKKRCKAENITLVSNQQELYKSLGLIDTAPASK